MREHAEWLVKSLHFAFIQDIGGMEYMKKMLKDQNTYSFVAEMRDEYGNVRVKRFKVFYISRELGRICIVRTDGMDIMRGEQR